MKRRLSIAVATIAATAIAGVGTVSAQEPVKEPTSISSTSSSLSSENDGTETETPEAPSELSSDLLEWNDNPEVVEKLEWLGVGVAIVAAIGQAAAFAIPVIRMFFPGVI